MRVLVTGASGYVGNRVCRVLIDSGHDVIASIRSQEDGDNIRATVDKIEVGDIEPETDWTEALKNVDGVIHLAARAHILKDIHPDPLAEFRRINCEGTQSLASAAVTAGVKRFVFVSSIGVNGDGQGMNYSGTGYSEKDEPAPKEPYALSKLEAEMALRHICTKSEMTYTIIRPPLVYGPGAPGNFRSLTGLLSKGIPVPLGAIHNRRSLIGLNNLADLLMICLDHHAAADETFTPADCCISTTELCSNISVGLSRKPWLMPIPIPLLKLLASLLGKGKTLEKLCGSLVVNPTHVLDKLGWNPKTPFEVGLKEMGAAYAGRPGSKP
ncbi:MAG: NAD-dependent epimerase/dehydratase family protein [Chthonomonadales bacterium]